MTIKKARSFGIDFVAGLLNLNSDLMLSACDYSAPPSLRNKLGWWIESQLDRLFGFFWRNSVEELDLVAEGQIPRQYMNTRQREFGREAALRGVLFDEVNCIDCEEPLLVSDEIDICASCRAFHPEMLLEDAKS